MFKIFKELSEAHIFIVKESKTFVGIQKKDYSKSFPVFGEVVDYSKKPFSTQNKTLGIIGIEHPTKTVFKLKDKILYPIAYMKFMWFTLKHFYKK